MVCKNIAKRGADWGISAVECAVSFMKIKEIVDVHAQQGHDLEGFVADFL